MEKLMQRHPSIITSELKLVHAYDYPLVVYAASCGSLKIFNFLKTQDFAINDALILKECSHINECEGYPRAKARLEIARLFLLAAGSGAVNTKYGKTKATALHVAAYYRFPAMVEFLITHGAHVNEKEQVINSEREFSALEMAYEEMLLAGSFERQKQVIQLMAEAGELFMEGSYHERKVEEKELPALVATVRRDIGALLIEAGAQLPPPGKMHNQIAGDYVTTVLSKVGIYRMPADIVKEYTGDFSAPEPELS